MQPGESVPKAFKRTLFVSFQPAFAESDLQQEDRHPDTEAECISAIRRQGEAERKIDQCSGHRLGDIIRQTHFPVETQVGHFPAETFPGIQKDEGGDQYGGKSEFLPHVDRYAGRLPDYFAGGAGRNFHFELIERSEKNACNNQGFYPKAGMAFRRDKKLPASDQQAQQEQTGSLDIASGPDGP